MMANQRRQKRTGDLLLFWGNDVRRGERERFRGVYGEGFNARSAIAPAHNFMGFKFYPSGFPHQKSNEIRDRYGRQG